MEKKYECPRCFRRYGSQETYTVHLQSHFPAASVEERTKVDHIVSSKMFKRMPSHDKRNPAFTGYARPKNTRKIGQNSAADQAIALALIIGELG